MTPERKKRTKQVNNVTSGRNRNLAALKLRSQIQNQLCEDAIAELGNTYKLSLEIVLIILKMHSNISLF